MVNRVSDLTVGELKALIRGQLATKAVQHEAPSGEWLGHRRDILSGKATAVLHSPAAALPTRARTRPLSEAGSTGASRRSSSALRGRSTSSPAR